MLVRVKGGPGSGHHGHAGRPGKRGGSASGGGASTTYTATGLSFPIDERLVSLVDTEHGPWEATSLVEELSETVPEYFGIDIDWRHFNKLNSRWTQGVDSSAKDRIRSILKDNKTIRTLTLYEDYSSEYAKSGISFPSFKLWLEESSTVYRFGRVHSEGMTSFARSLEGARDAANALAGENPITLNIKNIQLVGAAMTGIGEVYVDSDTIEMNVDKSLIIIKGGPGSGHHGHQGIPGQRGGSLPGSGSSGKVWDGTPHPKPEQTLSFIQTGEIGEQLAMRVLEEKLGASFSTMNQGLNNAPVDVAGDHHAVEVKTGLASNGVTAQHWRATIRYGQHGSKEERDLVSKMTKAEKRAYADKKRQMVMDRKYKTVKEMSEIAGTEIKPSTVGIILQPDGGRADVYMIPGFHQRLPWKQYAIEDYYLGTYDTGFTAEKQISKMLVRVKGGPGSGHWGHLGRPGKRGGSVSGGGLARLGLKPYSDVDLRRTEAARLSINRKLTQKMLEDASSKLGYDGHIIYGGEGYEFTVAGNRYESAAHYDPDNDRIVIFKGGMNDDFSGVERGLLAHEVTHQKWHKVGELANKQGARYVADLDADMRLPYTQRVFDWGGYLKDPTQGKRYTTYLWVNDLATNVDKFSNSAHNISSYAGSYWNKYAQTRSILDMHRAYNETFAEIANLGMSGADLTTDIPTEWLGLYVEFLGHVP